jgi:hypothetical protein
MCKSYQILYELAEEKKCSVHDVASAEWVIHFRIRLPPLIREQWYHLAGKLNSVRLLPVKTHSISGDNRG